MVLNNHKYFFTELSKEISYALRHAPWEFELELDAEGWVPVDQLIDSLQHSKQWKDIKISDIASMINLSEKKRHELDVEHGKIRALYGHSVPQKIYKEPVIPPKYLYHGTSPEYLDSIQVSGLLPMKRQYIHLSEDIETAISVGKRKDANPAILVINTGNALSKGSSFYLGNEKVWLSDRILPDSISIHS